MKTLAIRNGLWNALANASSAFAGAAGSVLIVRSLTPEAYGMFSYYIWLAGIIGAAGMLTFPNALTKTMSELRGEQNLREGRALSTWVAVYLLCSNSLISLGLITWAHRTPEPQRTFLFIIAAALVPTALAAVFRSSLWGKERYRPVSLTFMISSLAQLSLITIAYAMDLGARSFAAAVLFTSFVQVIGLAFALKRARNADGVPIANHPPSRATVRRYLAFAAPATLSLLFFVIIWERSEVFFLERFSKLEQVGYYSLAFTMYATCLSLGWALINGFFPAISRDYGAGEWQAIRVKVHQGLLLAILYAVPLSFGGWVTSERLITFFFGSKMLPVVPAAQVLFIGLLPGVVSGLLGLALTATGGIWLSVRLGFLVAAVNIVLGLTLIPRYGALGGAVVNTSSQLLYTALILVLMYRLHRIEIPLRTLGSVASIGALTTLLLPQITLSYLPGFWGLVGTILFSGCSYLLLIWKLGYLQPLRAMEAKA